MRNLGGVELLFLDTLLSALIASATLIKCTIKVCDSCFHRCPRDPENAFSRLSDPHLQRFPTGIGALIVKKFAIVVFNGVPGPEKCIFRLSDPHLQRFPNGIGALIVKKSRLLQLLPTASLRSPGVPMKRSFLPFSMK